MKKTVMMIMFILCALALCGCGEDSASDSTEDSETVISESTEEKVTTRYEL